MKNMYNLWLLTAVLNLYTTDADAQWTEIPSPAGFYIYNDLATLHGKVYTSYFSQNKLQMASTSDYIHWSLEAEFPVALQYGQSKTIPDGDRLYWFAWSNTTDQAFYSGDDAKNWTTVPLPAQTLSKLFLPLGDRLLCASDSTVFQSADNGNSWTPVLSGTEKVASMQRISDQTVLISTRTALYRSTDKGANWTTLVAPYDVTGNAYPRLTIYPTRQGAFLELRTDTVSIMFRSTDEGDTWQAFDVPTRYPGNSYMWDLKSMGNALWGVFNSGLAVSQDSGATWQFGLAPDGVLNLAPAGDTLFAGGSDGFFKTYDQGATWLSGNLGWEIFGPVSTFWGGFSMIGFFQDRLYGASYSGIYSTDNDGVEWRLHTNSGSFNFAFSSGDTLGYFGYGALRSFDQGLTWDYQDATQDGPLSSGWQFARAGAHLFAGAWFDNFLYRSADWGSSWQQLPAPVSFVDNIVGVDNKLFLSDYDGIRVSANFGQNFGLFNSGLGNHPNIQGMWGAGKAIFVNAGGQLFRLAGNTWKPASAGLFDDTGNIPSIAVMTGNETLAVLAGTSDTDPLPQIFQTQDGSQSWQGNLGEGLSGSYITQLALKGNILYANGQDLNSSDSHVWKRELTVGTTGPLEPMLDFALTPNPASDETWLVLKGLPESSALRVIISDAAGHLISDTGLAGQTRLKLPLDGLLPGVYVVAVRGTTGLLARKMLAVQR